MKFLRVNKALLLFWSTLIEVKSGISSTGFNSSSNSLEPRSNGNSLGHPSSSASTFGSRSPLSSDNDILLNSDQRNNTNNSLSEY